MRISDWSSDVCSSDLNDYIRVICDEFQELAGDRAYSDDAAIVGGLGRINGRSVMIIGHQKGRDTKAKMRRTFGMPRPKGYSTAPRLIKRAAERRVGKECVNKFNFGWLTNH